MPAAVRLIWPTARARSSTRSICWLTWGPTPGAYAWIAAGRLWMAGLGMFLLAALVGTGPLGSLVRRSGLSVLRLPGRLAAVPGHGRRDLDALAFLATDRLFRAPGRSRRPAGWRSSSRSSSSAGTFRPAPTSCSRRVFTRWRDLRRERGDRATGAGRLSAGRWERAWGWHCAAVQILPLGVYLAKSSGLERPPARDGRAGGRSIGPRVLDARCTAVPYVFGSQRRGHPNLARALGVHNLNESAGGYAGLATLIWLAPLAVVARGANARVAFLDRAGGRSACMGAFRWPPVDNLLRALPVLDVTDNRRLTLWVAFGLTLLGGFGLDQLAGSQPAGAVVARGVGRRGAGHSRRRPAPSRLVRAPAPRAGRTSTIGQRRAATPGPMLGVLSRARTTARCARRCDFFPRYYGSRGSSSWSCWPRSRVRCGQFAPASLVASAGAAWADASRPGRAGLGLNPAIAAETCTHWNPP